MRRLMVFNHVTLDGYFTDPKGDMSWAHKQDAEWDAFVAQNAKGGGVLVFGRITYEMMAGFWPTPMALKSFPAVAERMKSLPKVVFSRTLDKASWNNTKLVKGDIAAEVRRMKQEPGEGVKQQQARADERPACPGSQGGEEPLARGRSVAHLPGP